MPKLTKSFVEAIAIRKKQHTVSDGLIPGFCVLVSPNGKRHYYLRYLNKQKKRKRLPLGQHGIVTAEHAREEAMARLGDIKAGGDPHQKNANKKLEPLVKDLVKRFVDEHVAMHCKAKTQKEYKRYLDKHIVPLLGNIKISELNHSGTQTLHNSLRNTPYSANRCMEVLSKLCSLAEKWELRPTGNNPCKHIQQFSERARCRYLTEEEAARLAKALDELKSCQATINLLHDDNLICA